MRCADYQEQISALLDGELSWPAAWRLRRHLRACPRCARWQAGWQATRRALQRGPAAGRAPAGFWEGVTRRLDAVPSASSPGSRPARAPARRAAPALLVLAAVLLGMWSASRFLLLAPLPVQAMVAPTESEEAPVLLDTRRSSSPQQAAAWLAQRLRPPIPEIDLSLVELTLQSADLLRLPRGDVIGRLRYRGEGAPHDLFLLPGRRWDGSGWEEVTAGRYRFRSREVHGTRLLTWQRPRMTYVLVTREPTEEALRIAVQGARACQIE